MFVCTYKLIPKAVKISRASLAVESLNIQPGFDIPWARSN